MMPAGACVEYAARERAMTNLLDEVIVIPRRAYPRLPDLQVIERPGWLQIITPSIRSGGLNEVIYSHLDAHDADATIAATIATYRELGLKFRWNAGPGSGPPDLGERLERHGLAQSLGRGMARVIDDSVHARDDSQHTGDESSTRGRSRDASRVVVIEVDSTTLDDYTHVMAAGWDGDAAALGVQHRHILADGRYRLFVAYCDGVPAA
ncbi:MAG TPA: hypothetical protein VMZ53_08740, partial [Kofleriaceae bacterium]|nr:hypothetical protein [Kofleriaceae bacterium]